MLALMLTVSRMLHMFLNSRSNLNVEIVVTCVIQRTGNSDTAIYVVNYKKGQNVNTCYGYLVLFSFPRTCMCTSLSRRYSPTTRARKLCSGWRRSWSMGTGPVDQLGMGHTLRLVNWKSLRLEFINIIFWFQDTSFYTQQIILRIQWSFSHPTS